MVDMVDFPKVRITNPTMVGYKTKIELNGLDISQWVYKFSVGAAVKDAVTLDLTLYCGQLELESQMIDNLALTPAIEGLLVKHGWIAPGGEVKRI